MVNWNTFSLLPGQTPDYNSFFCDCWHPGWQPVWQDAEWVQFRTTQQLAWFGSNTWNGIENCINSLPCQMYTIWLGTQHWTVGLSCYKRQNKTTVNWLTDKNIHDVMFTNLTWIVIVKAFQFTLKNTGRVVSFIFFWSVNCLREVFT